MTRFPWQIKEAVQRALDELPAEKLEEVLNFALFLKTRWTEKGGPKGTTRESTKVILHTLPASHLDRLTGLVTWGGDAVADAERLYDDHPASFDRDFDQVAWLTRVDTPEAIRAVFAQPQNS
jgi:hypothetical protein